MFDWDDANVAHIAAHGVSQEEAEEALSDRARLFTRARSVVERRYEVIGATAEGRVLTLFFTYRRGVTRVVTARDADDSERRRYRRRRSS